MLPTYPSGMIWWKDCRTLIHKGLISVPEKPGLGVTLNEDVARRYARKGEPFFE